jgi:hypothetical protein
MFYNVLCSELLKITDKEEWTYRLNILKDTIDYWLENYTDKTVEVIQLFYDS